MVLNEIVKEEPETRVYEGSGSLGFCCEAMCTMYADSEEFDTGSYILFVQFVSMIFHVSIGSDWMHYSTVWTYNEGTQGLGLCTSARQF